MKRYVSALAVALCLVSFSKSAVAATSMQHELLINGQFGSGLDVTIGDNLGGTQFGLQAGYLYSLSEMFQVGGLVALGYNDAIVAPAPKENVDLKLLVNVNFPMNQGSFHSVFVGGGVGWTAIQNSGRTFIWNADVGIRYKIFESVTYRPTLGVQDRGAGIGFFANLLAMSLVF